MKSSNELKLPLAGTLCMLAATAILLAGFADVMQLNAIRLPASWYTHRPMWYMLLIGLFALGWKLLWQATEIEPDRRWRPTHAGRRFDSLKLYTREECPLCDEAKELLHAYQEFLPPCEEIDIDQHSERKAEFDTCVPVVEIDGRVRFRGRINEALLRRLIEGTQPA